MVAGIPDLLLKMRDDGGDNGNESIDDRRYQSRETFMEFDKAYFA